MKQYWLNLSLGTKIATLTSFLVMFSILALTFIFIRWEYLYFCQELENQASLLLETLPLTMRDQLYHMELDELIDIAKVVSKNNNVQQFVIFDDKGLILYDSSRPEMVFSQVVDPLGYILINAQVDQIYSDWQEDQFIAGKPIHLGNQLLGAVAVGLSTEALDAKVSTLTTQSLIFIFVTLIVGVGLSFWLGRQIASPLRELADIACQMAAGDVFTQIDIPSGDEVGQLGEAFNQMTASVQKREYELREFAAGLEQKIQERTLELRRHNKQLERIAIEDPLTGIYNRRHFFELAEKEIERAKRYGNSLAVVIMDADHFKKMNDTFGHLIGDQILISLAKLCLENLRGQDIIARYGGEEFVILMPEANHQDAYKTAERLRNLVAETSMITEALDVKITISLGVASWENNEQELNFGTMLARADQALYHSKETGRNRTSSWQELQDS
jgi:diguanylate cyclase (GGDEF)-like protein